MKKHMISARTLLTAQGLILAGLALPAQANLGSFSPSYGYNINVPSGSYNWSDVSYYNAGAYGVNSGGGPGPTHIAPDSGLWKVVGGVGGYFTTAAARSAATSGAPPYGTSPPAGALPIYMVGDHSPGRTDQSSLAFRNDTALGTAGAAVYDYQLDIYDTGGAVPGSVTSGNVGYGIYFATSPADAPGGGGGRPADRFTQSVLDSAGNIGAQWGYARDNEVLWRASASGPWNYSGIYANAGMWDRITINIDLTADTFQLNYFNVATSVTTVLAPSGTALGVPMNNFTALRWQLEDGTNGGIGGKNFFDDAKFQFPVPAPSSIALFGVGAMVVARRRRA